MPPTTPPLDESFPKEELHVIPKESQQICVNDPAPVMKLLTSKEELILLKSKLNMELKAELFKSCLSLEDFDKNFLQNEETTLSPEKKNEKKLESKLFSKHLKILK